MHTNLKRGSVLFGKGPCQPDNNNVVAGVLYLLFSIMLKALLVTAHNEWYYYLKMGIVLCEN